MATTTLGTHDSSFLKGIYGDRACKEVALTRNEVLPVPADALRLICLSGEIWLTREGDGKDYILPAGRSFALAGSVRPTVQALADSRLRLVSA